MRKEYGFGSMMLRSQRWQTLTGFVMLASILCTCLLVLQVRPLFQRSCLTCMLKVLVCAQVHSYVNPVRFTDAVMRIPDNVLLVEIGPHSILRSPVRQCRPALPYLSMMAKGQCAVQTLANAVSDMWSQGVSVQWQATPVPDSCAGSECKSALCLLRVAPPVA